MPNLILDLMVDRVDLVDEGANSEAFIKLYKRKESQAHMEFEAILAKMKPEYAETIRAEIKKAKDEVPEATEQALTKAKGDLEDAQNKLTEKEEEIKKHKKGTEESNEDNFEDVLKSLDPEVQKVFKSMQAQKDAAEQVAKQAAEEKAKNEALAKAKELSALPVEEDSLVEVLKNIDPNVYEVLKSANTALADANLFEEAGVSKGKDTAGTNSAADAWGKIEKKAEEIEKDQKISKQKAITIAVQQNPDLYKEYLEGGAN